MLTRTHKRNEIKRNEIKRSKNNSNLFFYNVIETIFNYIYKIIKFIIHISGIYILWIGLHYFASHLYTNLCTPNTIIGFLTAPFLTTTPHCQGLRWVVYNGANFINNMWVVFGTWLCSKTLFITQKYNDDNSS
jgi:hypothetical protein